VAKFQEELKTTTLTLVDIVKNGENVVSPLFVLLSLGFDDVFFFVMFSVELFMSNCLS